MIKKILIFVSIFGTLTNLYPALAFFLGVEFSRITLLFLLLNILILISSHREFKVIMKKKNSNIFFFFFLYVPILISLLTLETDLNLILINLYYLTIIFTSSILLQHKYKNLLALILFSALIFNLVTTIISMVSPELFLTMAEEFDKSIYSEGRGFGLFLQPNILGHSAILIFIFSIYVFFNNRKFYFWALNISMITVLLSGSRVGIAIFFVAIFIHYLINLKIKQKIFSYTKNFFFLLLLSFIFMNFSSVKISEIIYVKNLIDRMNSSYSIENFSKDPSRLEREFKRVAYYERIMKKPILGYGIGSQFVHKKKGLLEGSSHNTHLEIIYQGGILYYLFFIFFCVKLLFSFIKLKKYNEFLWSYCLLLICVFLLLSFNTSNLLQLRVLFVVFAPMLILNYSIPKKLNE